MKKLILLIFTVLLPLWINAQEYPTGITPYSFLKSWEYLISTPNNIDKAEAVLLNAKSSAICCWFNHIFPSLA